MKEYVHVCTVIGWSIRRDKYELQVVQYGMLGMIIRRVQISMIGGNKLSTVPIYMKSHLNVKISMDEGNYLSPRGYYLSQRSPRYLTRRF